MFAGGDPGKAVLRPQTVRDFPLVGYTPPSINETNATQSDITDMVTIENPLRNQRQKMERPWKVFKSPHELYGEPYLHGEYPDDAAVTELRAVSLEIIEPVFYQMEIS